MVGKEASARIKINKLLEEAGWRFFDNAQGPANILLENSTRITPEALDNLGDDFERTKKGALDYLLLDSKGRPLLVVEAKKESINPLSAKEQARKYARSQNCRFIILSNGNLHYFWDLDRGNPHIITAFPTQGSVEGYHKSPSEPKRLADEFVERDYIALTQRPTYASDAGYKIEAERDAYVKAAKLRFLRPYQLAAIHKLQHAVNEGKDRFLFEMATGTGKTLTAAAVIKLFLSTRSVNRVLFLVDRLELEDQAKKDFDNYLEKDFTTIVFKENRDGWRHADIVVSTVQSFLFNNKYRSLFSPTDFDLVISDEAHRSIGGNARAVFDYFIGYKLGLTATPRDYLKKFDSAAPTNDPRELERRLLLDTYRTFGCDDGVPTFRYSLLDGVREGFLINPTKVDARTELTTTLLSEQGFTVSFQNAEGEGEQQETYRMSEFEKKFFAPGTNELFCKTFLELALRDPISGEVGKSIIFAVSQNHAAKLVQILNVMADKMYPGKYRSDFAVQVTSLVPDAQQLTINFRYNNLLGSANFISTYRTSKARICVTVGMMTTGYDCPDVLNLGLMRPIFSPTEFIQIKGRGTRKHNHLEELHDEDLAATVSRPQKEAYKLIDFFAVCEYFEEEYDYQQVLELPKPRTKPKTPGPQPPPPIGQYEHLGEDVIATIQEEKVGQDGMKVDRMFYQRFEDDVRANPTVSAAVAKGEWDRVADYIQREVFDKPNEYYSLDKLRRAAAVDRRLTLREILEKIFGLIPRFKSKDELLEEEFAKFVDDYKPEEPDALPAIKAYFKAYATNEGVRQIINTKEFVGLATNPFFSTRDFKAVPDKYRSLIPEYIKDYVSINRFMA